jgi:hypothetical protein
MLITTLVEFSSIYIQNESDFCTQHATQMKSFIDGITARTLLITAGNIRTKCARLKASLASSALKALQIETRLVLSRMTRYKSHQLTIVIYILLQSMGGRLEIRLITKCT